MFENVRNNCKLYELSEKEILDAEKRMGIRFPKDLSNFYKELGYGFVINTKHAINRLIDPESCADIRLHEDIYEFDTDLEMYKIYEEKAIIFFEVNEGVYISIGINDGKIYFGNEVIADSLIEFLEKIVDPDYWNKSN
jgi:antitoxin YxxD